MPTIQVSLFSNRFLQFHKLSLCWWRHHGCPRCSQKHLVKHHIDRSIVPSHVLALNVSQDVRGSISWNVILVVLSHCWIKCFQDVRENIFSNGKMLTRTSSNYLVSNVTCHKMFPQTTWAPMRCQHCKIVYVCNPNIACPILHSRIYIPLTKILIE